MPYRSARPCSYPGCSQLVTKGSRCAVHTVAVVEQRDPQVHRLYGRAWQKRSKAHLTAWPWCEDCLKKGIYIPASEVHHEQQHKGDRLVFNTSPLTSLCKECHGIRTANEKKLPRGGNKVSSRGLSNVGVPPHEKDSQCEKFRE
jgi:5-methylcytosine-specific restriction protein A